MNFLKENENYEKVYQPEVGNLLTESKYYQLHEQAEKVRWSFQDINWGGINKELITDDVLKNVRTVAKLEFTTYPGAMNFFREFSDDMDFTQWTTMWLYEETRHPHVLMKWLSYFGEDFPISDMSERREVYPVGKDRIGTLAMNIISEMRAASWYLALEAAIKEPVLKHICRLLSADESRHASGFYIYAKKLIETSKTPVVEKMRALEMLFVWLNSNVPNRHPAGHFFENTDNQEGLGSATLQYSDTELVDSRVCRMFGNLTGTPLAHKRDIKSCLRQLVSLLETENSQSSLLHI